METTKLYHFTPTETNETMYISATFTEKEKYCFCNVSGIVECSENELYYFTFGNYCDKEAMQSETAFLQFLDDNETTGYSCGSYQTVTDLLKGTSCDQEDPALTEIVNVFFCE